MKYILHYRRCTGPLLYAKYTCCHFNTNLSFPALYYMLGSNLGLHLYGVFHVMKRDMFTLISEINSIFGVCMDYVESLYETRCVHNP